MKVRTSADGSPKSFLWNGAWHDVDEIVGQWAIAGEWYDDRLGRTYWRVRTAGATVDLFRDSAGIWSVARTWPPDPPAPRRPFRVLEGGRSS